MMIKVWNILATDGAVVVTGHPYGQSVSVGKYASLLVLYIDICKLKTVMNKGILRV